MVILTPSPLEAYYKDGLAVSHLGALPLILEPLIGQEKTLETREDTTADAFREYKVSVAVSAAIDDS